MSATYPLDMVRGRLTVQSIQGSHRYRGILHATSVIVKEVRAKPLLRSLQT
jgi:solute carrier family 25 phosphate transporter 23/24/25/41